MSELIFTAKIRLWESSEKDKATRHFVSLPKNLSKEVEQAQEHVEHKRGWGAVKVEAHIGFIKWKTSIFPSKKLETYILPIKKEIRKELNIHEGDELHVILTLV